MRRRDLLSAGAVSVSCGLLSCRHGKDGRRAPDARSQRFEPPRGFQSSWKIPLGDVLAGFGPFVGYWFRPETSGNFDRLRFVCANVNRFYASTMPDGAVLFEGDAILRKLPGTGEPLPRAHRINAVFFAEAPAEWLRTRPEPREEFLHFHSCYDASGPLPHGYWMRHVAREPFLFDMGARAGPGSPVYHEIERGPARNFSRIVEFDRGPRWVPGVRRL